MHTVDTTRRTRCKSENQNLGASGSNTTKDLSQRGYAKIRVRSYSPQWVWRCRSRGYRQLCSLWFEYDPCLNRKPPNDLKNCLTTLIRIRSTSVPKGGWAMIQIWSKKTPQWARHFANQMGIDSYVLFGSNTTYVWTGSPQVTILFNGKIRIRS